MLTWQGRAKQRRLPLKTDGMEASVAGAKFENLCMRMEDCDSESKHGIEVCMYVYIYIHIKNGIYIFRMIKIV